MSWPFASASQFGLGREDKSVLALRAFDQVSRQIKLDFVFNNAKPVSRVPFNNTGRQGSVASTEQPLSASGLIGSGSGKKLIL
jgi:hypothetical protein